MCFTFAISICRREKYFARMTMSETLARSDGWNEKAPNESQLSAPWDIFPKRNNEPKRSTEMTNRPTETHVVRRMRRSSRLVPKKTAKLWHEDAPERHNDGLGPVEL